MDIFQRQKMGYILYGIALVGLLSPILAANNYVVLFPKTLRPGLTTNVQINTDTSSAINLQIEIMQSGQMKYSSKQAYNSGSNVKQLALTVPRDLVAGTAQIKVTASGAVNHTSQADVTVEAKSVSIFIQTDKAMYKPSQTVNFRAVVVDPQLLPYKGSCDIEIKDPQGNRIKVWTGIALESGVLTRSLELSDQPVLGDWTIKAVTDKGETKEKKFKIDKYVLPKFEVVVSLPSYILVDDQVKATIEAKYTYGKGVEGKALARFSLENGVRKWDSVKNMMLDQVKIEFKDLQLIDGKADITLSPSQLTQISNYGKINAGDVIKVEVNVTETLTGITRPGSGKVSVYNAAEKLEFLESSPSSFKPGLSYTGFLKLSKVDGSVVVNPKTINLKVGYGKEENAPTNNPRFWWGPQVLYTYADVTVSVPENGLAPFSIDIPDQTKTVTFQAKYNNMNSVAADKTIQQTNSPSNSFVQLVLLNSDLKAGSQANFKISSNKLTGKAFYQILARGSVVASGQVEISAGKLSVRVESSMAPSARIIVYSIAEGNNELVADSLNFNVDGVFTNKVDVSYSKQKVEPGDSVDLQVTAAEKSLVALLAVDQSVLLLAQGNDITQGDVISEIRSYDSVSSSSNLPRFGWWWYPYSISGTDAATILRNSGLVALTNGLIYEHPENNGGWIRPIFGGFGRGDMFDGPMIAMNSMNSGMNLDSMIDRVKPEKVGGGTSASAETVVRKVFPESWLWSNSSTVNGKVVITTTVPDTITSWIASAFAISDVAGLGVAGETAKLQVFKPFFVSLNLPYSVVRGEQLILQAIVFNYLNKDVDVTVTLPKSSEYRSIVVSETGQTSYAEQEEVVRIRALAGKGTTVSFPIIPAVIGNMKVKVIANAAPLASDAMEKDLLVEAEGVKQSYNQAVLIDLNNSTQFTETITIAFPKNTVSDSKRVEFSVIGDIMGPSITGLDKLIQMPYGCGEQNMLNFAPTIFVTEYLQKAGQLTAELKSKSYGFMEKGYQRELTYQRNDGSFSAFGQSDPAGSMWLSAFVAKSFQKARQFIYVDEETILRTVTWMINKQNKDGSFPEPGRVIHKEMVGGSASSNITLTAYVLTALSEVRLRSTDIAPKLASAKTLATTFIENNIKALTDPYSLALCSYALFSAGSKKVDEVLTSLDKFSKNEGGMKFWEQPTPEPKKNDLVWRPPHQQSKAVNIELAAYAILVRTEHSGVVSALPTVRWLSSQRNANGGFSSTQDTVLALQALSLFASLAMSSTNMVVSANTGSQSFNYNVNPTNRLILQSTKLNPETTTVQIKAAGKGIALAQVAATYNIESYEQEVAFETTAAVIHEESNRITVKVCTKWLLTGSSGMAVKEIGIPTGFTADVEGLQAKKYKGVKRIEEGDRKVIIYYEELNKEERCIEVDAERTGLVTKAKPAAVRVYDYYEPENQQTIFYTSKLLNNVNICDVCGMTCEGCAAYFKRK